MTLNASDLTYIEQDALAEIANMGVSRAASSLRQMVGEQVLLSVPAVKIVTREAANGAYLPIFQGQRGAYIFLSRDSGIVVVAVAT